MKNNTIMRLAAKISAVAMVASFIAPVLPASAALPTDVEVQMTRHQISTASAYTLTFTGAATDTQTVTFDLTAAAALTDGTPACTWTSGTCGATTTEATNILELTCTGTCSGAASVTFNVTNAGTAGSKDVTVAGTAGYSGTFQIPILTDDTITVTASVTQAFTYDIMVGVDNTSCGVAASTADYALAFGVLTPGTPKIAIEVICMKLSTNADEGAIVEVKSLYAALRNAAADNYELTSATENLATDTTDYEGYGLCDAVFNENGVTGTIDTALIFEAACPSVGIVTTSFTEVANTATEPVAGGSVADYYDAIQLELAALASTASPSGNYTDDLTFRAYATF